MKLLCRRMVLASMVLVAGVAAAQEMPKSEPKEFRDIVYSTASGQKLLLDVFENPNATVDHPAPVLVYFHGGAWHKGERPARAGSFNSLYALGFSVVSVEYRFTQVAPAPAAVVDSLCSLSWVAANAKLYHFDVTRVVPYGTSAGGHLALMAGLLPQDTTLADKACGPLPKVAAILDFYGPADLVPKTDGDFKNKSLQAWIGSGGMAMAKQMSPITYVRKGAPAVFLVHGDKDPVVPYDQSVRLNAALAKVEVQTEFYTVKGGHHGGFSDEEKKEQINPRVKTFLTKLGVVRP